MLTAVSTWSFTSSRGGGCYFKDRLWPPLWSYCLATVVDRYLEILDPQSFSMELGPIMYGSFPWMHLDCGTEIVITLHNFLWFRLQLLFFFIIEFLPFYSYSFLILSYKKDLNLCLFRLLALLKHLFSVWVFDIRRSVLCQYLWTTLAERRQLFSRPWEAEVLKAVACLNNKKSTQTKTCTACCPI